MPNLSSLSVSDLQREIDRRGRVVKPLLRRRARIAVKLAALDREIGRHGGAVSGSTAGRTRPQNELTLADALAHTLKGAKMGVAEAADAVLLDGYKSNAQNFRAVVSLTFFKNPKRFKRLERGVYTAR